MSKRTRDQLKTDETPAEAEVENLAPEAGAEPQVQAEAAVENDQVVATEPAPAEEESPIYSGEPTVTFDEYCLARRITPFQKGILLRATSGYNRTLTDWDVARRQILGG